MRTSRYILLSSQALPAASLLGLTKAAADEWIGKQFGVLQAVGNNARLPGMLPESVEAQAAASEKVKIESRELEFGAGLVMPYAVVLRGTQAGPDRRALFISMHGGGGDGKQPGPHTWEVNTREFQAQIQFASRLYRADGVYCIPRMADDRLGRWCHNRCRREGCSIRPLPHGAKISRRTGPPASTRSRRICACHQSTGGTGSSHRLQQRNSLDDEIRPSTLA